jgi:glucosamine kinase
VADWIERATATDYAALAPIVVEHAASGNPAARRLMQAAGDQAGGLVEALLARGVAPVALCGGLAAPLKQYLPPEIAAQVVAPKAGAVAGGILLAKMRRADASR